MSWKTPEKSYQESKSIYDDLKDTSMNIRSTEPNLIRSDSSQPMKTITMPHTVAVFGYDEEEEENIENMLRKVGNVVDSRKDQHCLYLTYSTHVGAEKALEYHMGVVGKTRIAVELQKTENEVFYDPLQKKSWLQWIGIF
eukprot:NODE_476_length_7980_cov_0.328258.p8 type:complete len:140 gc:universal NODE_476_length_7980_cov_0.328258:6886-7305(+)